MFTVYTDGACQVHTTQCGAIAGLIVQDDDKPHEFVTHYCDTTSQRMELAAVTDALSRIHITDEGVLVKTDSTYVVDGYAGLYDLKANPKEWEALRKEMARFDSVILVHIRRNSEPYHARVDELAKAAAMDCPITRLGLDAE